MCKGSNEQSLLFLCMNLTGVWGYSHQKENESVIQFMRDIKMVPPLAPQDASLSIDSINMIQSENGLF